MISNKQLMNIAFEVSKSSYARKMQVGALLVKDNRIISTGYNGTLSGLDNECEDLFNTTYDYVVHAEANAIINAYKLGINDLEQCEIFITHSPCANCLKLIAQAGIRKVYFNKLYKYGKPLWAHKLGITFIKVVL